MAEGAPEDRLFRLDAGPLGAFNPGERARRRVPLSAGLSAIDGVRGCDAPFAGVALWVSKLSDDGTGLASPPSVEWSLRARYGGQSEEVVGGTATWPQGWDSSGLLVQVAGRLAEGWELWARSLASGGVAVSLRWAVVPASSLGGPVVTVGSL